jgi:hypothetical protein
LQKKSKMILLTFHLNFFFSISDITSHTVVNPGDDAEMVCTIDANPIKENTVQWTRYNN